MSLGDINMITSGAPALTALFGWLCLKEKAGCVDVINVFIIIVGVILILKPPAIFGSQDKYENDPQYVFAVISVLGGTVIMANVNIILRILKGNFKKNYF